MMIVDKKEETYDWENEKRTASTDFRTTIDEN